MKNLIKILIFFTFFATIFYYASSSNDEVEPLKSSSNAVQPIPKTEIEHEEANYMPRPTEGISTYIGKEESVLQQSLGKPTRIDTSAYGYEWWIYLKEAKLQMYGVLDGVVKQAYTNSSSIDVSPYQIDQSMEEIYRITPLESEIIVEKDRNVYLFMMDANDLKSRIIVPYDGVFAQLYIDLESKTLSGVRYMDKDVLLLHQPYEYQYFGDMLPKIAISSLKQYKVDMANANQIYDLINEQRTKANVRKLMKNTTLSDIARERSESLYIESVTNQDDFEVLPLEDYLKEKQIIYKSYEENLAYHYYDAIEAYHGWLNSEAHRKNIYSNRYSSSGTGVYMGYFTQIFIEVEPEQSIKN